MSKVRLPGPEPDSPGVVVFPPLLFGSALLLGFILQRIRPVHPLPDAAAYGLGGVVLLGSLVLALWAERVMHAAGTNVRPDQPTLAIVTGGPFRYTRNPLYIASTGLVVGLGLLFNALWPLVLVLPVLVVVRYGVVAREERYLEKKFGETYLAYKGRVRRWF